MKSGKQIRGLGAGRPVFIRVVSVVASGVVGLCWPRDMSFRAAAATGNVQVLGGLAMNDFGLRLAAEAWKRLILCFLLTYNCTHVRTVHGPCPEWCGRLRVHTRWKKLVRLGTRQLSCNRVVGEACFRSVVVVFTLVQGQAGEHVALMKSVSMIVQSEGWGTAWIHVQT